jgi:hypothetical protein
VSIGLITLNDILATGMLCFILFRAFGGTQKCASRRISSIRDVDDLRSRGNTLVTKTIAYALNTGLLTWYINAFAHCSGCYWSHWQHRFCHCARVGKFDISYFRNQFTNLLAPIDNCDGGQTVLLRSLSCFREMRVYLQLSPIRLVWLTNVIRAVYANSLLAM